MNPRLLALIRQLLYSSHAMEGIAGSVRGAPKLPLAQYRKTLADLASEEAHTPKFLQSYKTPNVVDWNRAGASPEDFPHGLADTLPVEVPDLIRRALQILYRNTSLGGR